MIQTQCNNFDALQMVHPKWVDDTFDMNGVLEYGRSKFNKTKDGRIQMGVHSAHYLIFAPAILLEVRFALAKYYCFHLDMILANGYLTLEEVDGTRKIFQAYLMNLTYDDVVIATDDELRKFEGKEIDDEDGDDIVYDSGDENEDADDNNRNNNKGSSNSNKNIDIDRN
jgi:hypothetical protein